MIIYNITIKVDWSIAEEWLKWMQEKHLPEIFATGCFSKYQLVRLLQVDETEGPTYAAQLFAKALNNYNEYLLHYEPDFQKNLKAIWGNKYLDFRTLMQVVCEN